MPTLNWIGRDKVLHHEVLFRMQEHKYGLRAIAPNVYHIGASINDHSKQWISIMKMLETKAYKIIKH